MKTTWNPSTYTPRACSPLSWPISPEATNAAEVPPQNQIIDELFTALHCATVHRLEAMHWPLMSSKCQTHSLKIYTSYSNYETLAEMSRHVLAPTSCSTQFWRGLPTRRTNTDVCESMESLWNATSLKNRFPGSVSTSPNNFSCIPRMVSDSGFKQHCSRTLLLLTRE